MKIDQDDNEVSEVSGRMNVNSNEKCAIKILKLVKKNKTKGLIRALRNLCGGPNLVELSDTVRVMDRHLYPSLLFDYVNSKDFQVLYPTMIYYGMHYCIYEFLKALDYCHSQGILLKDVKPYKLMIDHELTKSSLIDWGSVDFYYLGKKYHVASSYFKGPDILVDLQDYDYTVNIWSLGCLFAGMVFCKEPFFDDHDNQVHFVNIHNVLGTDELNAYLNKHQLMFEPQLEAHIGWHSRKPWSKVTDANTQHLVYQEGIDFLDKLHYCVHPGKLTTKEGMSHHYFSQVRACAIHQTQEFQANTTIDSCKWGADPITTMMTIKHYGPVQIFDRAFLLFLAMSVQFLPWYFIIAMFWFLLCHFVVLEVKNSLWGMYCYGLNSIGSIMKNVIVEGVFL